MKTFTTIGQTSKRKGNWRAVCGDKSQARFGGGLREKANTDLAYSLSYRISTGTVMSVAATAVSNQFP